MATSSAAPCGHQQGHYDEDDDEKSGRMAPLTNATLILTSNLKFSLTRKMQEGSRKIMNDLFISTVAYFKD